MTTWRASMIGYRRCLPQRCSVRRARTGTAMATGPGNNPSAKRQTTVDRLISCTLPPMWPIFKRPTRASSIGLRGCGRTHTISTVRHSGFFFSFSEHRRRDPSSKVLPKVCLKFPELKSVTAPRLQDVRPEHPRCSSRKPSVFLYHSLLGYHYGNLGRQWQRLP